ncbi:MAG: hypothetical protein MRQ05_05035 [Candidatus Midichloria mitochondrii]|nr:hypothetical protein [Candidatus Midichloria mitochondrii]
MRDDKEMAEMYHNVADIHNILANSVEAQKYYEQSIHLRRGIFGENFGK